MTTVRTVWKVYRFELASVVVVFAALIVVMLVLATRLQEAKPSMQAWEALRRDAERLGGVVALLPVVLAALLGAVLVSREVELRTDQLSWSLGPSRGRWLAARLLVVGVPLLLLLLGLAIAANTLEAGSTMRVDPRASLAAYGQRDIALVARGMAAFAVGVLVGAAVGRQLPAVLVSALAALVALLTLGATFPFGIDPQLIGSARIDSESEYEREAAILAKQMQQGPDGTLYENEEVSRLAPAGLDEAAYPMWLASRFDPVEYRYTGDQLTVISLRESAALATLSVLAVGGAFVIVERREPS